jgi:hypothetical protein
MRDAWGETIKKIAILSALVMAIVAVPAMAQDVDLMSQGMFQTGDSAFKFPVVTDTNFDNVVVGNDYARAFGYDGFWNNGPADAQNNLLIEKNQNVGACASCCPDCRVCSDACTTVNIEQIKVGDRNAQAFGFASAVNSVKIVTNQEST